MGEMRSMRAGGDLAGQSPASPLEVHWSLGRLRRVWMPIQGAGTAWWQEDPTMTPIAPAPDLPPLQQKAGNAISPMAYKTSLRPRKVVRYHFDWHSNYLTYTEVATSHFSPAARATTISSDRQMLQTQNRRRPLTCNKGLVLCLRHRCDPWSCTFWLILLASVTTPFRVANASSSPEWRTRHEVPLCMQLAALSKMR
jgi:hypothetical protein